MKLHRLRKFFATILISLIFAFIFFNLCKSQNLELDSRKLYSDLVKSYPGAIKFENNLILFVNFVDFSCHLCLEDFLNFLELVKLNFKGNIVIFFRRDYREIEEQRRVMGRWMQVNNLNFPFFIDDKFVFDRNGVKSTSAFFVSLRLETCTFIGEFPMLKGENFLKVIK